MKKTLSLVLCVQFVNAVFSQDVLTNLRTADGNLSQYLMNVQRNRIDYAASPTTVTSFNNAPNTAGKRFLFDSWVKGDSILLADNQLLPDSQYLFNYDKLTGSLIATLNKTNIIAASPAEIQSFILVDQGTKYRFKKLDNTGSSKFYLLLNPGKDYSLYRSNGTVFTKANFRTDGITQSGSRDDEYKDQHEYFVVDHVTGKMEPVSLRAKSIKQVFASRKSETQKFFRLKWDKHIDEAFLIGLVDYLNVE